MNFDIEVLEKSKKVPVLVDFWAPWCGPCQFLGPVLEELAAEANGKWELVKVNSDEHPDLGAKYQIRSIPAVKLFSNGEIIGEFTGSLPKHQIQQWLEEYIPDERKLQYATLLQRYQQGNDAGLTEELALFIKENPDFEDAKILMAKIKLFEAPEEALALVSDIKLGDKHFDSVEHIRNISLLHTVKELAEKPVTEYLSKAAKALAQKDFDQTLEHLIQAVMTDKNYLEDMPRKCTIALFNILGEGHELTRKYRRSFNMALY